MVECLLLRTGESDGRRIESKLQLANVLACPAARSNFRRIGPQATAYTDPGHGPEVVERSRQKWGAPDICPYEEVEGSSSFIPVGN